MFLGESPKVTAIEILASGWKSLRKPLRCTSNASWRNSELKIGPRQSRLEFVAASLLFRDPNVAPAGCCSLIRVTLRYPISWSIRSNASASIRYIFRGEQRGPATHVFGLSLGLPWRRLTTPSLWGGWYQQS